MYIPILFDKLQFVSIIKRNITHMIRYKAVFSLFYFPCFSRHSRGVMPNRVENILYNWLRDEKPQMDEMLSLL